MRKNAIQTFTSPTARRPGSQSRSEAALELGEHAFGLPTLSIDPPRKTALHPTTIATADATLTAAEIHRDDGGPDAQFFAAEPMVRFGVIAGVAQQPVDRKMARRLRDGGLEVGGIVAGPRAHLGRPDEVRVVVADHGDLGPGPIPFHAALSVQEVPADVVTFQAGGVDAGLGLALQQASGLGSAENGVEQLIESPFFRSRCSA
jgi:hypothetical protein